MKDHTDLSNLTTSGLGVTTKTAVSALKMLLEGPVKVLIILILF